MKLFTFCVNVRNLRYVWQLKIKGIGEFEEKHQPCQHFVLILLYLGHVCICDDWRMLWVEITLFLASLLCLSFSWRWKQISSHCTCSKKCHRNEIWTTETTDDSWDWHEKVGSMCSVSNSLFLNTQLCKNGTVCVLKLIKGEYVVLRKY